MSVDTQTVTLGTSGNFIGYSGVGTTYGSISDGTANAYSGAAWDQATWDSVNFNFRIMIDSTSMLATNFDFIEMQDGQKFYGASASKFYISFLTATQFYWGGVTTSPWGGASSGTKTLSMNYGMVESSHGIQVFNSSNQSILNTADIVNTVIGSGLAQITTDSNGNGISSSLSAPGMTTTNAADMGVLFFDLGPIPTGPVNGLLFYNRGTNSFTIQISLGAANTTYDINYQAVIYGDE
jgi:hypothetical protein